VLIVSGDASRCDLFNVRIGSDSENLTLSISSPLQPLIVLQNTH